VLQRIFDIDADAHLVEHPPEFGPDWGRDLARGQFDRLERRETDPDGADYHIESVRENIEKSPLVPVLRQPNEEGGNTNCRSATEGERKSEGELRYGDREADRRRGPDDPARDQMRQSDPIAGRRKGRIETRREPYGREIEAAQLSPRPRPAQQQRRAGLSNGSGPGGDYRQALLQARPAALREERQETHSTEQNRQADGGKEHVFEQISLRRYQGLRAAATRGRNEPHG
jgi:hypothetical protein